MKKTLLLSLAIMTMISNQAHAQYSYGDKWYNNPLGFEPLKLHTSMGFIIPAAAVGTCLLLTKNNPSLKQRLSVYNEIGMSWGYKYPKTFCLKTTPGLIISCENSCLSG